MRIRYVVSSMIFWGREHSLSLEAECELLKSLGFGIELWPNIKGQNECRYMKRNWPRLAAATEGMLVAMRSRHDHPTLKQWSEQIECAKLLDAHIVTDLQSIGIPDEPELDGCDFADEVVKLAEEKGVTLCLETGRLAMLKEMGKRFESVRYCLDTGHAYLDGESSFKQYVDNLGPRVAHLHLSDYFGLARLDTRCSKIENPESGIQYPESKIQSNHFGFPGGRLAYQGLCRFWCGGGMPLEDWDYLLESLNQYHNDIVGSIEMSPCMPAVMIRQASEFLFDTLKWPNRPGKSRLDTRCAMRDDGERPESETGSPDI
jgi:sugar phosphate isomerase/epimerase